MEKGKINIINNTLKVVVKPNAPKTKIIEWDENKQMLRIAIAAVPDKGKANKELIKFLSKELGKKVEIIRGRNRREKMLKIAK